MSESSNYPLGCSEDEAQRLASQAAFFEDLTADVLRRAGIGPGMKVLDLGCGIGDVSVLAARMVGERCAALGIDRAASSVETARRRAGALGARNIRFEVAELDAFDSAEKFGTVIGRLVLLYQPDPVAILRRFRNFLNPNGIIGLVAAATVRLRLRYSGNNARDRRKLRRIDTLLAPVVARRNRC